MQQQAFQQQQQTFKQTKNILKFKSKMVQWLYRSTDESVQFEVYIIRGDLQALNKMKSY